MEETIQEKQRYLEYFDVLKKVKYIDIIQMQSFQFR